MQNCLPCYRPRLGLTTLPSSRHQRSSGLRKSKVCANRPPFRRSEWYHPSDTHEKAPLLPRPDRVSSGLRSSLCRPVSEPRAAHPVVLHAARLLDVESGRIVKPGEVLVQGERLVEVGSRVAHPASAEVIDLETPLCFLVLSTPMCICFLHPGAEDLQTVEESVRNGPSWRHLAAEPDLMAGFTAERDMGTEGAGSADTAVRNAIDRDSFQGPGCASAPMPSTFSAGTRTQSTSIRRNMCCPTRIMRTIPPSQLIE